MKPVLLWVILAVAGSLLAGSSSFVRLRDPNSAASRCMGWRDIWDRSRRIDRAVFGTGGKLRSRQAALADRWGLIFLWQRSDYARLVDEGRACLESQFADRPSLGPLRDYGSRRAGYRADRGHGILRDRHLVPAFYKELLQLPIRRRIGRDKDAGSSAKRHIERLEGHPASKLLTGLHYCPDVAQR